MKKIKCFISNRPCFCDPIYKPNLAFVISPFSPQFNEIYDNYLRKGIEGILIPDGECRRADQIAQIGFVMCQKICMEIQQSEYIIADISNKNYNVYYEIGLSYGLRKKIVFLGNKPFEKTNHYNLVDEKLFFHYRSLEDFTQTNVLKKILNTVHAPIIPPVEMMDTSILVITSKGRKNGYLPGLLEKVIEGIISRKDTELKSSWKVKEITLDLDHNISVQTICEEINKHKVIVIDTTNKHPLLFFCLGLSHSLEKESIPLIPEDNDSLPFDLRGLWHIFYRDYGKDYAGFRLQFENILLHIDRKWFKEKEGDFHKRFWKSFIENEKLKIVACARHWDRKEGRHAIEGWDYKTVSTFSSFLSSIIPSIKINTETLWCKYKNTDESIISCIEELVRKLLFDENAILIGSTEVNDISELVLSTVNHLSPYSTERIKKNGYVLVKSSDTCRVIEKDFEDKNLYKLLLEKEILFPDKDYNDFSFFDKDIENEFQLKQRLNEIGLKGDIVIPIWQYARLIKSSFYWKPDNKPGAYQLRNGKIVKNFENETLGNNEFTSYGILTLINNPYVTPGKRRKIALLSGFTGPCTYGISKVLTDFSFEEKLNLIAKNFTHTNIVEALIKVKYYLGSPIICTTPDVREVIGDTREFRGIEDISIMAY